MAGGTGGQAARGIAGVIEGERRHRRGGGNRPDRQTGIMKRHCLELGGSQLLRDPTHLGVIAPAVGIGLELPLEIARIEPRQTRRPGTIAAAVKSMAGEAGIARASLGTAQRDKPAAIGEAVERGRLGRRAAAEQRGGGEEKKRAHSAATPHTRRLFLIAAFAPLLQLAACKPPPEQRHFLPFADATRGKAAVERVGCAACHTIPGVDWPRGKVGPHLDGLADRALIAGQLPNRPDVLAAYVRNAPALVQGSGMPAMPVSEAEARDIAAFLYHQGAQ